MDDHQRISAKLSKFVPSLTLELKRKVAQRRAEGLPVYDFGLGETKGHLDERIRAAGEQAFREEHTMYTDPAGLPELRDAVLRWLNLTQHYTRDDVVVTVGAKQALFNVFLAVTNPADAVLFDAAPWVSYQPLAVTAYAFPVMVLPLGARAQGAKVTPADLIRNLDARPHAKLFLINNPCNPTAQLYSADEIEALLRICVERRIYFVLDRLYWRIVFDGRAYPEPRVDAETRPWLIQVDGMSKNFRRTGGMRIGWAVGPRDVIAAMVNLQSHYTSGPATPTQRAALAAIDRPYEADMVRELEAKRNLLLREAADMPHVTIWPTPATFYSFWDVTGCFGRRKPDGALLKTSDDVAKYLLESAGVATASGSAFMQPGFLRLSFATSNEDITAGMAAARKALGATN
ncbi:MAG: aminotransferase class I/II-fold pyridoxal phosphate-dependent enzyme [Phycisphaerales bacterium]|nr:MAG: aminotransferase class I/II-fold pyridoxal phosphate-dependent enzyme [Phycisphaerales bacterium]